MDALGQPLENLSWDPELRGRTRQLIADQRAMAPAGDFEEQMRKVRDIRFEFTRMEVEVKYLGMHVIQDFMKALGLGPDTLLQKLEKFNAWVTHNLPEISKKIVTWFMPVWSDIKEVLGATAEAARDGAMAFSNLMGALSGDSSISGTEFSLHNLLKAVKELLDGFAEFAKMIANVEDLLAHLVSAVSLVGVGKFKEAHEELIRALNDVNSRVIGGVVGGTVGFAVAGPAGAIVGAGLGAGSSAPDPANATPSYTRNLPNFAQKLGLEARAKFITKSGHDLVETLSQLYGVDPKLAHAVALAESGESHRDKYGNVKTSYDEHGNPVARGLMQLTGPTAKTLGVNAFDEQQNARGGVQYLRQLLERYNFDMPTTVAAYHEGPGKMAAINAGRATLSVAAQNEVSAVMRSMGKTGDVNVGGVTIHINQPNASPQEIQRRVTAGIADAQNKRIQRTQQEFNQSAWAVGGSY